MDKPLSTKLLMLNLSLYTHPSCRITLNLAELSTGYGGFCLAEVSSLIWPDHYFPFVLGLFFPTKGTVVRLYLQDDF